MPPLRELSMRDEHGNPTPIIGPPLEATSVTIFVHGYNNSQLRARMSYYAHVVHLGAARVPAQDLRRVCLLYWPGDRPLAGIPEGLSRKLGSVLYPQMVENALVCGRLLADYLA